MAPAIGKCQQTEGNESTSLLDLAFSPCCEASGTALFAHAFLWGVNNKILDKDEYSPIVEKAWEYIQNKSLSANALVGYVQAIAENATRNQQIYPNPIADC
jgi:rhamnogalacturonyl hydrolase YesR